MPASCPPIGEPGSFDHNRIALVQQASGRFEEKASDELVQAPVHQCQMAWQHAQHAQHLALNVKASSQELERRQLNGANQYALSRQASRKHTNR